tara:strand:+ start:2770 stop:2874 length:105 start_codon:yes stop_codon:yes gene_type:complete
MNLKLRLLLWLLMDGVATGAPVVHPPEIEDLSLI